MTDKQIIEEMNFHFEYPGVDFNITGRLGKVIDVRFVRCYWPVLDKPVNLFATGSRGIEVMGPPTPRNIVFPPDTVFLPQEADDGPLLIDGQRTGVPRVRRQWRTTDIMTKSDCFFLREKGTKEVTVMDEVHEEHQIDGQLMLVKVMRPRVEVREADIITHLSIEEARQIAGG
jgi:hypothetical protein